MSRLFYLVLSQVVVLHKPLDDMKLVYALLYHHFFINRSLSLYSSIFYVICCERTCIDIMEFDLLIRFIPRQVCIDLVSDVFPKTANESNESVIVETHDEYESVK